MDVPIAWLTERTGFEVVGGEMQATLQAGEEVYGTLGTQPYTFTVPRAGRYALRVFGSAAKGFSVSLQYLGEAPESSWPAPPTEAATTPPRAP